MGIFDRDRRPSDPASPEPPHRQSVTITESWSNGNVTERRLLAGEGYEVNVRRIDEGRPISASQVRITRLEPETLEPSPELEADLEQEIVEVADANVGPDLSSLTDVDWAAIEELRANSVYSRRMNAHSIDINADTLRRVIRVLDLLLPETEAPEEQG